MLSRPGTDVLRQWMADGVPRGKVRQKSAAGIVGVEVSGKPPNLRVTIDQTPATFGPSAGSRLRIAAPSSTSTEWANPRACSAT